MILLCEMFWSFALIFIYCEFGERVSTGFSELNDAINQFNWYTFPIEIQRDLPIVMIFAQEPVVVSGFGNIACVRLTFKSVSAINSWTRLKSFNSQNVSALFQVVSKGFKRFMMLREFGT